MTEQVTVAEFYHNTHALYMMMADMAPVYKDFEFETAWDVHQVFPDLQVALLTRDGRSVCFHCVNNSGFFLSGSEGRFRSNPE
jgi:hypothetical protein